MNEALVIETLTLVGASALSIALLSRIGLPAVLGYLFAGILVGPLGFGVVAATEGTRFLAELGLILLMFMVGLEHVAISHRSHPSPVERRSPHGDRAH